MGDLSREPSMEEILSSIRRVIARDEQNVAPPTVRQPEPTESEPEVALLSDTDSSFAADDVLDLTELSPDHETDLTSELNAGPMPPMPNATLPTTTLSSDVPADATDAAAPELVAPESAAASRQSLDTLAAVLAGKTNAGDSDVPSGDISVNALVEAALRPMLKQWLDANLPDVVERLVAREISRITSGQK